MATEKRLIDANELVRFCDNEIDKYEDSLNKHERNYAKAMCVVKKIARTFPTVDAVEVVHGRWELVEFRSSQFGVDQEYQCSICGTPFDDESYRTRYCPNCGAKMDGGNEDV